jgi:endoglucanase
LVLVAHLDHPGFAVTGVADGIATLTFRGGLAARHAVAGSPVDFFRRSTVEPVGRGELVVADEDGGRLSGGRARALEGDVAAGDFAMWGFPGFDVVDGRITGRACDDLLGAAVVLSTLDQLSALQPEGVAVWGLFTRAEEIGFLGTLEAIRLGTVPPWASVLSLECSQALPGAPQGGGVIVRVGDRRSIFDPGLSEALRAAAEAVGRDQPAFRWQRKLMDGGTCEASAFCALGFRASGLALPLGNYHNASDEGTGVGPEHVAVDDYLAGVQLLVELACSPELLATPLNEVPAWLVGPMARARAELGAGSG